MATTTPNFGWSVPTSTDLVKDGATAIETLGDSIDASLLDLKGGTSGQVLAKNSGTDMDFIWSTPAGGSEAYVQVATGSLTSGSTLSLTGLTVYDKYMFMVKGLTTAGAAILSARLNSDSTTNYRTNGTLVYGTATLGNASVAQQAADNTDLTWLNAIGVVA